MYGRCRREPAGGQCALQATQSNAALSALEILHRNPDRLGPIQWRRQWREDSLLTEVRYSRTASHRGLRCGSIKRVSGLRSGSNGKFRRAGAAARGLLKRDGGQAGQARLEPLLVRFRQSLWFSRHKGRMDPRLAAAALYWGSQALLTLVLGLSRVCAVNQKQSPQCGR